MIFKCVSIEQSLLPVNKVATHITFRVVNNINDNNHILRLSLVTELGEIIPYTPGFRYEFRELEDLSQELKEGIVYNEHPVFTDRAMTNRTNPNILLNRTNIPEYTNFGEPDKVPGPTRRYR